MGYETGGLLQPPHYAVILRRRHRSNAARILQCRTRFSRVACVSPLFEREARSNGFTGIRRVIRGEIILSCNGSRTA